MQISPIGKPRADHFPRTVIVMLVAISCTAPLQPAPSTDLLSGDYPTARAALQAATDRAEPEAMVNLGYMYARGHGVPADPAQALALYRRAAAAGDAEAMNAVGYRYNFAAKPDLTQAIHWYCQAVIRGNPRAMNNLAILFLRGQGVPQDRDEARNLWRQAVRNGSLNAAANLGIDLASDTALPAVERQAGLDMLRATAQRGSAFAQSVLRRNGDTEPFPAPSETELTMKLEPRNPTRGQSYVCSRDIS